MSRLDDIIKRFSTNSATAEDIEWALPILTRYRDRSKRSNQNRESQKKLPYITQPIDFTKTPVLIKVLENVRLIFTEKSICLESEGRIVAAKRANKYYYIDRINLSKIQYDADLVLYQERVKRQKDSGLLSSKPGRLKKDGSIISIDQLGGKPILAAPNWTISIFQAHHIKKFIGNHRSVTISPGKFEGILERLSDSVTVSYTNNQSDIFWDQSVY